jgi:hypothetical protein
LPPEDPSDWSGDATSSYLSRLAADITRHPLRCVSNVRMGDDRHAAEEARARARRKKSAASTLSIPARVSALLLGFLSWLWATVKGLVLFFRGRPAQDESGAGGEASSADGGAFGVLTEAERADVLAAEYEGFSTTQLRAVLLEATEKGDVPAATAAARLLAVR